VPAMSSSPTLSKARTRLGLEALHAPDAIGPAFRRAVRAVAGSGDDTALRELIAARDLLLAAAAPEALPAPATARVCGSFTRRRPASARLSTPGTFTASGRSKPLPIP